MRKFRRDEGTRYQISIRAEHHYPTTKDHKLVAVPCRRCILPRQDEECQEHSAPTSEIHLWRVNALYRFCGFLRTCELRGSDPPHLIEALGSVASL